MTYVVVVTDRFVPACESWACRRLHSDVPEVPALRISIHMRLRTADSRMVWIMLFIVATLACSPRERADIQSEVVGTSAPATRTELDQPSFASPPSTNSAAPTSSELVERKGVLIYDVGADNILVPDPALDIEGNGFPYAEVYSGLLRHSTSGDEGIEPDLAESFHVSNDGLTYTFRMRSGLRFSDGSPVDAFDVKFSWERALAPSTGSSVALHVFGEVRGAHAVAEGRAAELDGIDVVDATTFRVELERGQAEFPWLLTTAPASVLEAENVASWTEGVNWAEGWFLPEFTTLPTGTGPFAVAEIDLLKGRLTLKPNPHYWDHGSDLDAIEFVNLALADSFTGPGSWEEGALDVTLMSPETCQIFGTRAQARSESLWASLLSSETAPRVSYLAFNTAVEPLDDVAFRRALVKASDLNSYEFEPNPDEPGAIGAGLLPPSFPGHDARITRDAPNRANAMAELESSRYQDELRAGEITMIPNGLRPSKEGFEAFTANWRDWIGLDANFTDLPISRWLGENRRLLREGTLQLRYLTVEPAYPSPHAILRDIPDLFGPNAQSAETDRVRRMIYEAQAEQDDVARLSMYQEIERYVLDQAMVLPMYWDEGYTCHEAQDWVTEFKLPKWGGSIFRSVRIDTDHPAYPDR